MTNDKNRKKRVLTEREIELKEKEKKKDLEMEKYDETKDRVLKNINFRAKKG